MAKVGIVCDSTCDLDAATLEALDVHAVPLKVLFDNTSYLDWVELQPSEFYKMLAEAPMLPKTSQPSPADFAATYRALADQGCDAIVSIHLSAALSGTHQSATLAAADAPVPVHVIDTKKVTQATGLVVKAACEARGDGLDGEAVAAHALKVSESMRLYFVLDTLEYLVKGGRAGKAQGLAASLLDIKPVLDVNADGIIEPFKKVKGRRKALATLAQHVAEESRTRGRMRLSVLHACDEASADELRAALDAAGTDYEFDSAGLVGAVVGTYAGPRAVGCAYYPLS